MTQKSCTVGIHNAILRNYLKFRSFKIVVCCRETLLKAEGTSLIDLKTFFVCFCGVMFLRIVKHIPS